MPYKIGNPRGVPAGIRVLAWEVDGRAVEKYEGDPITKREFPGDWELRCSEGFIVKSGRASDDETAEGIGG